MSDSASPSAFSDGRLALGQKAMASGFGWLFASLATAIAIYAIVVLIADQNQREAGRRIVDAQKGSGYIATLVGAYALNHGRAGRF